MRWHLALLTLAAVVAGGFVGRHLYLRSRGAGEGFFESVAGLFRSPPPAPEPAKEPRPGAKGSEAKKPEPEATHKAEEPGGPEKGAPATEPSHVDPATLRARLAAAQAAYDQGRFSEVPKELDPLLVSAGADPAVRSLAEQAARLAARGRVFASILDGVQVDSPPGEGPIHRVTLENGNTLFAVRAETEGDIVRIETDTGIKFEWEKARLRLAPVTPEEYRKEKRVEFEKSIEGLDRNSYIELYRAARQAYRRGFNDRARGLLEEALALPSSETLLTFFARSSGPSTARAWRVAAGREAPFLEVASAPAKKPAPATAPPAPGDTTPAGPKAAAAPKPGEGSRKATSPLPGAAVPSVPQGDLAEASSHIDEGIRWYRRSLDADGDEGDKVLRKALAELDEARKILDRVLAQQPELRAEAERRLGEIQILRVDCHKRLGFGI
ncbi:MAG: hypothetical protein JXP34_16635 [Planctomycetes bacterium]|nr:hypothetical protein [Planctomycetota bacterium]